MWLLFEIGVFMAERFAPAREPDESSDEYKPLTNQEMEDELDQMEDD